MRNVGGINAGQLIFYGASFLILLSIPITVKLLQTGREQVTRASPPPREFSGKPTILLDIAPVQVVAGGKITVKINLSNSNGYAVYFLSGKSIPAFSPNQLFVNTDTPRTNNAELDRIMVGVPSTFQEFSFLPTAPGYIAAVSYQNQEGLDNPRSGDLICFWDGNLYIFRREFDNPITELYRVLTRPQQVTGEWDRLAQCENSGPKRIEVVK